jgi:3D (Asp-Asp-Asp) domain-containing protein
LGFTPNVVQDMRRLERLLVIAFLVVLAAGCITMQLSERRPDARRKLVVTGYCKCQTCCSWHRNWLLRPVYSSGPNRGKRKHVGITASGTRARPGTLAADPTRYPFGTILYVDGYGYGRVEDTGGDIKGDHIDLYFKKHSDAEEWGRQIAVAKIWYPPGWSGKSVAAVAPVGRVSTPVAK